MEKELKQKWINALRSGKYEQDKGQLKSEHGYCCLGVFACVADMKISDNGLGIAHKDKTIDGGWGPIEDIIGADNVQKLWMMNDGSGREARSFNYIADYIETNL